MAKAPVVPGLILCEKLVVDQARRKLSLQGLHTTLVWPEFPSPPQAMTAYCLLFDGRGEGLMRLRCMHLETEKELRNFSRWIAFPRPGITIHYEIPLRVMVFKVPGRYAFSLFFDKQLLTTRYLDVRRS